MDMPQPDRLRTNRLLRHFENPTTTKDRIDNLAPTEMRAVIEEATTAAPADYSKLFGALVYAGTRVTRQVGTDILRATLQRLIPSIITAEAISAVFHRYYDDVQVIPGETAEDLRNRLLDDNLGFYDGVIFTAMAIAVLDLALEQNEGPSVNYILSELGFTGSYQSCDVSFLRDILSEKTAGTKVSTYAAETLMRTLCPTPISIEAVIAAAKKLDDELEETCKTGNVRNYDDISTIDGLWDKLDGLWQPCGICQILAAAMVSK